jgi:hypothetical protein
MYMKHHNTSFISPWLHRMHLLHSFPFSSLNPILGEIWDGPCWVSSLWVPFPSVLLEDLCYFLLPSFVLFSFLITIAVPPVARDIFCHCCIAPPAAVRLLETEGCYFSRITVLGFLPSTANASVVPRHSSVHLRIGDFFCLILEIRRVLLIKRATSCRIWLFITHGRSWAKEAIYSHHMPLERVKADPFPTP